MYQDTFNNNNVANMSLEEKQRARKRSHEIKKVGRSVDQQSAAHLTLRPLAAACQT